MTMPEQKTKNKPDFDQDLFNLLHDVNNPYQGSQNPHYKSKFADLLSCLKTVKPALKDNNFALQQVIKQLEGGGSVLQTNLIHISGKVVCDGGIPLVSKDANDPHIHPYSVFSGSFYIDVAEDSGGLKFWNPAHETMGYAFNDNISKYEQTNCSTWTIVPMTSMLVLFPGYIKHSVGPNMNKKLKRISISFNLVT